MSISIRAAKTYPKDQMVFTCGIRKAKFSTLENMLWEELKPKLKAIGAIVLESRTSAIVEVSGRSMKEIYRSLKAIDALPLFKGWYERGILITRFVIPNKKGRKVVKLPAPAKTLPEEMEKEIRSLTYIA